MRARAIYVALLVAVAAAALYGGMQLGTTTIRVTVQTPGQVAPPPDAAPKPKSGRHD